MAVQKVAIHHTGSTNVGKLYLSDVGRRNSLGGGVSVYNYGQDQYISPGQTLELVATSQVLLSIDRGMLKTFSKDGTLTVTFL